MQRIAMSVEFRGAAKAPEGEPPQTDPHATSVTLTAVAADGSAVDLAAASYAHHATHTGPTTFVETGTIRYDDGAAELDVETVGEGSLGPSADPDLLHGAVLYRVTEGRGRFAGATGMITSNFLLRPAAGEFEERQVAVVFVP